MVKFGAMKTRSTVTTLPAPGRGAPAQRVRLKPIIVPAEHGGWGFLTEALLLGLLIAPTGAGALLAIATVLVFLSRQPTKLLLTEWRRRQFTARSRVATVVMAIELSLATLVFALALYSAGLGVFWPLILALPFGLIFLTNDMAHTMRTFRAEIAAPLALGAITASMALMGGWSAGYALAFWIVIAARAIPTVLLVRERVKLNHKRPARVAPPLIAHSLALLLIGGLIWLGLLPPLAVAGFVVLLVRAIFFLFPKERMIPARTVGFIEIGIGLQVVLFTALGVWLQL